jgi:iron(III) transport system ATP-binding protein
MLEITSLSAGYGAHNTNAVLRDISFTLDKGELLCLLGASGCGKSTLLKTIAGLHTISSGTVSLAGKCLSREGWCVPAEKREVGIVFQQGALFPHLTVLQNVRYGQPRSATKTPEEWLTMVGLEEFASRYPHQLSGGQQQRLALVRAMAAEPAVLLLDEPFSGLDVGLRCRLREEVRCLLKQAGIPAILVTHDPEEAMLFADRILLLRHGRIEQLGSARDLYHSPASPYVVRFFSAVHELQAAVQDRLAHTPFGTIKADFSAAVAQVLIRPEAFRITEAANGLHGTITATRFLGTRQLLTVQSPFMAEPLSVIAPPAFLPATDNSISLVLDPAHAFAFPL